MSQSAGRAEEQRRGAECRASCRTCYPSNAVPPTIGPSSGTEFVPSCLARLAAAPGSVSRIRPSTARGGCGSMVRMRSLRGDCRNGSIGTDPACGGCRCPSLWCSRRSRARLQALGGFTQSRVCAAVGRVRCVGEGCGSSAPCWSVRRNAGSFGCRRHADADLWHERESGRLHRRARRRPRLERAARRATGPRRLRRLRPRRAGTYETGRGLGGGTTLFACCSRNGGRGTRSRRAGSSGSAFHAVGVFSCR